MTHQPCMEIFGQNGEVDTYRMLSPTEVFCMSARAGGVVLSKLITFDLKDPRVATGKYKYDGVRRTGGMELGVATFDSLHRSFLDAAYSLLVRNGGAVSASLTDYLDPSLNPAKCQNAGGLGPGCK